jgi:eukaryotic-like serine/threonine-protein kinase
VLTPGVLIDDRYRLDDRLATGGMGDVWRATDVSLGRPVAVKVLLPALLTDPSFGTRFRSEARMLAALHHPGVVRVYDYGEGPGPAGGPIAYLVMEYVDGEPLSNRLANGERLPSEETMDIVAQAAKALHAAHTAGIVHRDVKPSNLLLRPDGSVMLVDFGVARSTGANTNLTSTNAVVGTAMYMAPEQASGRKISPATDIYALGAVAYHCLAGHPPFMGGSPLDIALRHVTDEPPALPDDVPAPVRDIVGRALAKDPAERFPSAAAFAQAAGAAVAEPALAGRAAGAGDSTVAFGAGAAAALGTRPAAPFGAAAPTAAPDAPVVAEPDRRGPSKRVIAAAVAVALLILGGLTTLLMLANRSDGRAPGGNVVPPTQSSAPATAATTTGQPAQPGGGPSTRQTPSSRRSSAASAAAPSQSAPATARSTPAEAPTTTTPAAAPTTTGAAAPTQSEVAAEPDATPTTPGDAGG